MDIPNIDLITFFGQMAKDDIDEGVGVVDVDFNVDVHVDVGLGVELDTPRDIR